MKSTLSYSVKLIYYPSICIHIVLYTCVICSIKLHETHAWTDPGSGGGENAPPSSRGTKGAKGAIETKVKKTCFVTVY